jgi:NADH-quinone oxidoreductase subunit I
MNSVFKYLTDVFRGVKTLVTGMKVTGYYFVHPREITTQQYPENRKHLVMFDRFKGEVIMPHDQENHHRCTGCGICQINCPNGSIEVKSIQVETEEGKKKRVLDRHMYHLSMCTFCGLCVKTCPSDALAFGNEFEHAVYSRSKLTKILNRPGSALIKGVQ